MSKVMLHRSVTILFCDGTTLKYEEGKFLHFSIDDGEVTVIEETPTGYIEKIFRGVPYLITKTYTRNNEKDTNS